MNRFLTLAAVASLAALTAWQAGADQAADTPPVAGDPAAGAAAYQADCASCHRTPVRFMRQVPGDDDVARAEWLEAFLPEHYAPDPQTRADIIAWLIAGDY